MTLNLSRAPRLLARRLPAVILVVAAVVASLLVPSAALPAKASPQTPPQQGNVPFVVESYYRFRWGSEAEFMDLFKRNHVPFLQKQLEKGLLLEVRLEAPHEHQPEEGRWDLRMTLVYPDAATAYRTDKITEQDFGSIIRSDTAEARFNREERRRFELLEAHWDVNVKRLETLTRP